MEQALAYYEQARLPFGRAIVAHARELGAWLESRTRPELATPRAAAHHTPEAAMREIAIPLEDVLAQLGRA